MASTVERYFDAIEVNYQMVSGVTNLTFYSGKHEITRMVADHESENEARREFAAWLFAHQIHIDQENA